MGRAIIDVVFVPFLIDGRVAVIRESSGSLILPQGEVLPGEEIGLDTAIRVPLGTAGFRMQHFHPFRFEGSRLFAWIEGDHYSGRRPHFKADLIIDSAEAIAKLLRDNDRPDLADVVTGAERSRSELSEADYLNETIVLLEAGYLRAETPRGGSGFGGSEEEWRLRRAHILDGIERDGSFLDVGCANGYLMECVRKWGRERGLMLEPYGVDVAPRLVELARRRLPEWKERIWLGNALEWAHPEGMRFDFVHALLDLARPHRRKQLIEHLLDKVVVSKGRLLVSHYIDPAVSAEPPAAELLASLGYEVAGVSSPASGSRAAPTAWIAKS